MIFSMYEDKYPTIELTTRRGTRINNAQVNTPLPQLDLVTCEDMRKQHPYAVYRTQPCGYYNCHGLTFASRRTKIWATVEIGKILNEDGYIEIAKGNVLPGDIVIYYQNGDAQHSGIIIEKTTGCIPQFRVLSKWGQGHEVIHMLTDCTYNEDADAIKFYRVVSHCHGGIE